jgi:hypothetical protein
LQAQWWRKRSHQWRHRMSRWMKWWLFCIAKRSFELDMLEYSESTLWMVSFLLRLLVII